MADSWLIDGNCDNCRRQKYCSKPCKLHIQRGDRLMSRLVTQAMFGSRMTEDTLMEVLHHRGINLK